MLCSRRELLAILCQAYRFIGKGGTEVDRLPAPVVAELTVVRDTLLLCYSDLGREPLPRMYCSDASGYGYALHVAQLEAAEFWSITAYRER
jgi:hypothetical protein